MEEDYFKDFRKECLKHLEKQVDSYNSKREEVYEMTLQLVKEQCNIDFDPVKHILLLPMDLWEKFPTKHGYYKKLPEYIAISKSVKKAEIIERIANTEEFIQILNNR